jgi:antitoxin component of MazEF toxin-antitoxin module
MITLGTWGKALAARLPSHICKAAGLRAGMVCTMRLLDDGSIRIQPAGDASRLKAAVPTPEGLTAPRRSATW